MRPNILVRKRRCLGLRCDPPELQPVLGFGALDKTVNLLAAQRGERQGGEAVRLGVGVGASGVLYRTVQVQQNRR